MTFVSKRDLLTMDANGSLEMTLFICSILYCNDIANPGLPDFPPALILDILIESDERRHHRQNRTFSVRELKTMNA
jgi:hypothetical protein